MIHAPPDHEILEILRPDVGQGRAVARARFLGQDCVTRVLQHRLDPSMEPRVQSLVLDGEGTVEGLPAEIAPTLEGYRVRARLGDELGGLPEALDAGLDPEGRPYITTRWIPGEALQDCYPSLSVDERGVVLEALLGLLRELHARRVLHGDLKPQNVIVGGGGVHLIDLDTLQQVSADDQAVPVTHLTRRYAAPEQNFEHRAWLSSDLYAFGTIIALLMGESRPGEAGFPPQLPAPWGPVMRACLRERPMDRTRAEDLLEALRRPSALGEPPTWAGEAVAEDVTVRVLDAPSFPGRSQTWEDTEEVDDSAALAIAAPATGRGWLRRLAKITVMGVGGLTLLSAGFFGVWTLMDREQHKEGRVAVLADQAALRAELKAHKTEPAKNVKDYLGGVLVKTEAAVERWPEDPDVLGLHALATVWHQGWHYKGARWDLAAFQHGEEVTARALEAGESAEGYLARALLAGAACRLMPPTANERTVYCAESREHFDRAVPRIESDWLMVEARWGAVMILGSEAARHWSDGQESEASLRAESALKHCEAARPHLDRAPINNYELAEDCVIAAGTAGDEESWIWWSEWLIAHRKAHDRSLWTVAAQLYSSAHPVCSEDPVRGVPEPPERHDGGFKEYCGYMTMLALGCPEEAEAFRGCGLPIKIGGRCVVPIEQDNVPWRTAKRLAKKQTANACQLD